MFKDMNEYIIRCKRPLKEKDSLLRHYEDTIYELTLSCSTCSCLLLVNEPDNGKWIDN